MRIIADKNIPFLSGVLEPYFDVEYLAGFEITPKVAGNADALLVRTRTLCNATLLKGSTVRFIGSATIGFDHIDTDYCQNNGIFWANAPGCNSAAVQQWVAEALIYWAEESGHGLNGCTIGIVGVGNVGSRVAKLAEVLGMNVLCCDPPRKRNESLNDFVDFDYVLTHADIITFHVPLNHDGTDKTYHMLSSQALSRCKPNVLIINSSRGEVIRTDDLVEFLTANKNSFAALDVWENEPSISSPLLSKALVATPHIAGYSLEGKVMGTKMIIDSLSRFYNLGIHPWMPSPDPLAGKVVIDRFNDIHSAIKFTYNIKGDDLRNTNADFETYRNSYRYRRDFSGHQIGDESAIANKLRKIGFSVKTE